MDDADRISAIEKDLADLLARQVSLLAENEALLFALAAALRCVPQDIALRELRAEREALRAATLAADTSDEIEELRAAKAEHIFAMLEARLTEAPLPPHIDA
jgi:hypothetical protein